jgi:MFS family permease
MEHCRAARLLGLHCVRTPRSSLRCTTQAPTNAILSTFTCISVVPVANRIVRDLSDGGADKSASVLLVTIWELGEAAGPLLIAPLSEIYGRYPVLNIANGLFIIATVLAATSQSVPLFVAARALTGLAVTSNVLGPAIIGDMFVSEQRGSAMSLIMLAPLIGGAVGPAISGAVAQTLGWRQVLWLAVGLAGACEILFLFAFKETYKVPILQKRADRLRKQYGRLEIRSEFDATDEKSWGKIGTSVLRPAVVLSGSGVLLALSLFGSVVFTYFYVLCVSLPDILEDIYDLPPALTGSAFACFSKWLIKSESLYAGCLRCLSQVSAHSSVSPFAT